MEMKKSKKKMIIILSGIVLLIVFGVLGGILISQQMNQKSYSQAIKKADKYVEAGNYALAVVEYKNAIEKMPKKEEGYISLANTYLQQGNNSAAKVTLKKGYLITNSSKIQYMITGIEDGSLLVKFNDENGENSKEYMPNVGKLEIDTSFLQKLENYSYSDYSSEFGTFPEIVKVAKGEVEVVHKNLAATCYYTNTSKNKDVVDTKKDEPKADGMPEKVVLDDISLLFRNYKDGITLAQLQEMSSIKVEPILTDERTYVELAVDKAKIRIETDENGTVKEKNVWNEILLPTANKEKKNGVVSGVVIDAMTGQGVPLARVTFEGKANQGETSTGSDGAFQLELKADEYEVTISAQGYVEETFEFKVEEGCNYSGEQFTISPELATGSARIVLEWGAQPEDLDSYLSGTTDDGNDVFVSFFHRQCSSGGETIAELDVDDTTGYGPETITLNNLNGKYIYYISDFRQTGTFQEYGATVKVYLPNKSQPEIITMDPGAGVENVWDVFELDHGELKILNRAATDVEMQSREK